MNELKLFENADFGKLRIIDKGGEPWFVGKDVAEVLGYSRPNEAIRNHVDSEDTSKQRTLTNGGIQDLLVINESGLYSLILSSKLPRAKEFKRWVTSEVLPAIRKHGIYADANTVEAMLADPDTAIKLLTNLKEERIKRTEAESKLAEAQPKVIFADAVSASKTSILIGDLAKILNQNGYKTGQKRLFEWLRQNGYLIKRKGADYNSPTQKAMEQGLFEIKETSVALPDDGVKITRTTKVTGKGQLYFVNLFAKAMANEPLPA